MISATRRWFRRNKTPIAIGLGVLGAGYVATQYVLSKISDARQRMSSDRIARENLRRRFEQNQEDCTFTVLALLPTATDNILAELETEQITFELQQQKAAKVAKDIEALPSEISLTPSITDDDGKSIMSLQSESGVHASQMVLSSITSGEGGQQPQRVRKSKLQLWNDLKISSITRAFTLIYTLALLTLLTRVQLNLLGRRSYLSSVVSLAAGALNESVINLENNDDDNPDQAYGNDFETNRRYLTFSWWLLHRGWRDVMHNVQVAVREIFGPMSIRDDITMEGFSEMTLEVRKRVEGATESDRQISRWLRFLLPPRDQENFVLVESGMTLDSVDGSSPSITTSSATPLRRLLDETSDLIDSPPFAHVLTLLLDAGFSMLVDQKLAQQSFKISSIPDSNDPRLQEAVDAKPVKLPIVLATLTRQAHSIGNGVPNEYLQTMEQVRDLEAFAAVVYSSNWESEITLVGEDSPMKGTKGKESSGVNHASLQSCAKARAGQESFIEAGGASTFEEAWGKAAEKVEGKK